MEGYNDLIAGTIKFDENYQGTLKLPLPSNDGTVMDLLHYKRVVMVYGKWHAQTIRASGTLKWDSGSVTGTGRDYKNKTKFTVAKKVDLDL